MEVKGKVVAITGAANGIGYALARRFKQEGARGIALADLDGAKIERVAVEIGAIGAACDVARETDIQHFVRKTEDTLGPIDLFCSNAGIVRSILNQTMPRRRRMKRSNEIGVSTLWRMYSRRGRCCRK